MYIFNVRHFQPNELFFASLFHSTTSLPLHYLSALAGVISGFRSKTYKLWSLIIHFKQTGKHPRLMAFQWLKKHWLKFSAAVQFHTCMHFPRGQAHTHTNTNLFLRSSVGGTNKLTIISPLSQSVVQLVHQACFSFQLLC